MKGYRVWAEIDLVALRHNISTIRRVVGPSTRILAVVKADAYGHGAVPVAWSSLDAGCDMLGVGDSAVLRRHHQALLEAKGPAQPLDGGRGIAVAQRGDDAWGGGVGLSGVHGRSLSRLVGEIVRPEPAAARSVSRDDARTLRDPHSQPLARQQRSKGAVLEEVQNVANRDRREAQARVTGRHPHRRRLFG